MVPRCAVKWLLGRGEAVTRWAGLRLRLRTHRRRAGLWGRVRSLLSFPTRPLERQVGRRPGVLRKGRGGELK